MKRTLALEYNSTRDKLQFYEYGRCIQKMIQFTKTIEDKERRQAAAESIVEMINMLNPQSKNILEYKQKLWRHVFAMAGNDLDVEHPFDNLQIHEDTKFVPSKVPYPQHEFKWKHYGYNIRVMIDKALNMEDGPIKKGYIDTILGYMKMSYRNWNKEHFVSDDIIVSDLAVMSNGKIVLSEDHTIHLAALKANQPNANQTVFKTQKKLKKPNYKKPTNSNSNMGGTNNNKFKRK